MVTKSKPAASKKTAKKKKLSVDFTGVEAGGGRALPDGSYDFEITSMEEKESNEGNAYLNAKLKVIDGKHKGTVVYDTFSLLPQSLWKLRTLLEVCGFEVPEGEMDLDPDELIGEKVHGEVANEKYDGKDRPRITGYSALGGEEESEEEEAEEETEDDESEEEEEEESEEEEAEEEEEKPAKKTASKKTVSKSKFKIGSKVKFKDDKNKTVKGTVTAVDGTTYGVTDSKDEEWEIEESELEAA